MRRASQYGFTLVELSIVLVILGLLVGGVLAGQSLIHAAELRRISTEFTSLKTALGAFREKYNAVPGDMPNAVRFWGADSGGTADGYDATCAGAITWPPTGTATCNGDGDGKVSWRTAPMWYEIVTANQHLINAGLIEGSYHDAIASRYPSGGWNLLDFSQYNNGTGNYFAASYGNILSFGLYTTDAAWDDPTIQHEVLKAEDAYNIDAKMDDTKPGTGRIVTWRNTPRPNCANAAETDYDVSNQNIGCSLFFISGY